MRLLFACVSLCISIATNAQEWQSPLLQDHRLVGKIVAVDSGDSLITEALLEALKLAPYVVIGEKHDNPDHHAIELQLLEALAKSDSAVVFEMLNDQQAPLILGLQAGLTSEAFKQQLQWPEKGWAWQDYGPLMQLVVQQGSKLSVGNIDREKINQLYTGGLEILSDKQRFETIVPVSKERSKPITELVFDSHCKMMPREHLQPMVNIQLAKDASMAYAMLNSGKSQNILIAGNVHARKDVGVPQHLAAQGKQSVTVAIIEVQESLQQVADYPEVKNKQADYVWFTPKVTDRDYCQDLKGRAKK
ncbi:ChaN family lipoprotein [Maricurvus nonylphenolicus]|uniref:ChaN family lipoprotein n=1 Tax=Maricurvus nonylphenolicus TaxID=1008307 RepID=UPI0036F3EAB4